MNLARPLLAWLLVLSLSLLAATPGVLPRRPSRPATRARVTRVTRTCTGPLHLVLSRKAERLKVFRFDGRMLFTCRAKNDAICLGCFHWGRCPPGAYGMARPLPVGTPAFGPYFIKLLDLSADGPFHRYGRHGIGLHGGGSRLPEPLARWQGWLKTRGCWRLQNRSLTELVPLLHTNRAEGYHPTITIQ